MERLAERLVLVGAERLRPIGRPPRWRLSRLYREIERQAAENPSVIGLRLYFETDNTRAQATYRALGMSDTTYGLMERYPLPGRKSDVQ